MEVKGKAKSRVEDLTGKRFGRLTVLSREENDKHNKTRWKCKCDCGKTVIVGRAELIRGDTKSCGCYIREKRAELNKETKTKHGLYNKRIYVVWKDMIYRCEKPYIKSYKHYGARGIKVCDEWHDISKFAEWCYQNGYDEEAEKGQCTIERIDVNGDYEPANCTFTDMFHQNCNRTNTLKGEYKGKKVTLMELCKKENVEYKRVYSRINQRKDTFEEAIERIKSAPKKQTKDSSYGSM